MSGGGQLFSPAGGGLKDEHDRPLDTLNEVYGISESKLRRIHRTMNLKIELPRQSPVDRLYPTSKGAELGLPNTDAYAFRQEFPKPTGETFAHFADRVTPAMVANQFGKGHAAICGLLPGVAYVKPCAPVGVFSRSLEPDDLMHFRPTSFADPVRDLILLPVRQAGVAPVASCDPVYVEAVLWEHGDERLLILNNHSGEPLGNMKVTIPGLASATGIRSQQGNQLKLTRTGDDLQIELPIRLFDFIFMSSGGGE